MKPEKQSCPARDGWGPWERGKDLDLWITTRWGTRWHRWWERVAHGAGPTASERSRRFASWFNDWLQSSWRRRLRLKFPRLWFLPSNWHQGGTYWAHAPELMPRSCSFCGCAHPDDVQKLLDAGWQVHVCDNRAKCYIQPPDGYGPVPPVKIKTYHCTPDFVAELNKHRYVWQPPPGIDK